MYRHHFIFGLVIALGFLLFYQGFVYLWPEGEKTEQHREEKLSLFDLNFIPTKNPKPLPEGTFIVGRGNKEATTRRLVDLKGKPIIVHVWHPSCGYCVQEMPSFDAFARRYGQKINIIPLTLDPSGGELTQIFYVENNLNSLEVCVDQTGTLSGQLGIRVLPTTIFYNAEGLEQGRISGTLDWGGEAGAVLAEKLLYKLH